MNRRNLNFLAKILLFSIAGVCLAGQAAADGASRTNLAPPGPCAEPRVAVGASDSSSRFSVVGPIEALFNPLNVAAAPSSRLQAAPVASVTMRPGACDEPGAGCRGSREVLNPPIVPGGRPVGAGASGEN